MGCWNETCVLTRTPITCGKDVVALSTVLGPQYKEPSGGGFKTSLLFGLPLKGQYDDYGGVEDHEQPTLVEFENAAFLKAGVYREHVGKKSYGMETHRLIASHPKILWGLEHSMKHLFYGMLGVSPSDADSYDEKARAKTLEAFKRCQTALETLGKALRTAEFAEDETKLMDQLFALVTSAFGEPQAWAAWDYLKSHGLFASRGVLMMHRSAYDAVVKEFSQHKVYYYGEKGRKSLRTFLAQELENFVPAYEAEQEKLRALYAKIPGYEDDEDLLNGRLSRLTRKSAYMGPLTQPWMTPEAPLTGHYWGGATVREVVETYPHEDLLDALVFQWARHYLRIELTPPSCGSQNEEVRLHQKMHQAVYRDLRAHGRLKSDFSGCLHR